MFILNSNRLIPNIWFFGDGDPPPTPPAPTGEKTYTEAQLQSELNHRLKGEKTQWQQKVDSMTQQLQQLQQSKGLTEQERTELQTQIDNLQATVQTEQQKAQTDLTKLQKKYDTDIATHATQRDQWKNRFERKLVSVDIYAAANKFDAFNAQQIEAILAPLTKVEEDLADGKPTGDFITKVDFTGVDKEGKPVKLKLTVDEAVKMMTDMPQTYGNLFKAKGTSGTGIMPGDSNISNNGDTIPDLNKMTPQQYQKHREQIMSRMANT